jgi:hypothetical protein
MLLFSHMIFLYQVFAASPVQAKYCQPDILISGRATEICVLILII